MGSKGSWLHLLEFHGGEYGTMNVRDSVGFDLGEVEIMWLKRLAATTNMNATHPLLVRGVGGHVIYVFTIYRIHECLSRNCFIISTNLP